MTKGTIGLLLFIAALFLPNVIYSIQDKQKGVKGHSYKKGFGDIVKGIIIFVVVLILFNVLYRCESLIGYTSQF